MQQVPLDDLNLIGLEVKKARKYCNKKGWQLRVVKNDGIDCLLDFSRKSNRINVEVVDDKVYDIIEVG